MPTRHPEESSQQEALQAQNHALAKALTRAREALTTVKSQMEAINHPPLSFATFIRIERCHTDSHGIQHASAEVLTAHKRLIVPISPSLPAHRLTRGTPVMLNEQMTIVSLATSEHTGAVRHVDDIIDEDRLIVTDANGNRQVVQCIRDLHAHTITSADRVMLDASGQFAIDVLPREQTNDLLLEETPDVTFADIGGLDEQIAAITDAVELPFTHRALFDEFQLQPPKGVLLYGPPGNGKTLIAKAVAHSLAQTAGRSGVFLSVKGPELLNKYVGESERLIRVMFERARERASDGTPVIVFIDEMDALLRTRGSGVSSDVETTIVPQFLAELDGVEQLKNVIVIGASNRIDMIDPAVLRPGRLDVKIRIDRPNRTQAAHIVAQYLSNALPIAAHSDVQQLINQLIDDVFSQSRVIAQMSDDRGVWEPLYFADVISGAMLKNMVDRAKMIAVKASIAQNEVCGIDAAMITQAVQEEYDAARATLSEVDPVQWSRVNGIGAGHVHALRVNTMASTREGIGR